MLIILLYRRLKHISLVTHVVTNKPHKRANINFVIVNREHIVKRGHVHTSKTFRSGPNFCKAIKINAIC